MLDMGNVLMAKVVAPTATRNIRAVREDNQLGFTFLNRPT